MYSSYPSAPSPYGSPPPPNDPYRQSPVPMNPKQPYAFSPPPVPPNPQMGFMRPPAAANFGYNGQPRSPYPQASPRYQTSSSSGYRSGPSGAVPAQPSQLPPAKHKGTLAPGQIVQVGDNSVRIEKYLSEGGYAHVYLTTSDKPIYPPTKGEKRGRWGEIGFTQHCLKRIAFQDESVWADVKKEIEVMKALPPNPHLTQYLGSAHTKLPRGGYEVYILMEFCSGGGIIDLLNKRLRDRLKEIEILNIFTDVCEAVAAMHALKRPLLHRDLKIENVLSSPSGQPPSPGRPTPLTFKLCDFGSTTYPATSPPSSKLESDTLALDLNKNTTLQYRSPEMVEPMLGLAVGLPSDVWALGVLLYKLCYYTTPFEEHGTLAIVNAKYTFPQFPVYSPRLQHLIASMLLEQPIRRPSVFEVLKQAHEMSGTKPEIDYPTPSRSFPPSQSQRQAQLPLSQQPTAQPSKQSSTNLLDFTSPSGSIDRSPSMQPSPMPTVQPQRRGRPTPGRGPSQTAQSPMPIPPAMSPAPAPMQAPTPVAPKLQVTGERAPSPKERASIDAFGMPSVSNPAQRHGSGFGDSFGASAQNMGSARDQPNPGFSDSFGGKSSTSSQPSGFPQSFKPSAASQNSFASFNMPRTTSPTNVTAARRSDGPSSSEQNEEVSFETRFPSIETLSSGDALSPPMQPYTPRPGSAVPNLISPITSPPAFQRMPSVMGNMTGGDMASNHLSAPGLSGPQPRSTHVTGTAFKGDQSGMLSPGSSAPIATSSSVASSTLKKDYFQGIEAKPLVSRSNSATSAKSDTSPGVIVPDLMMGDNEDMSGQPMRPTLSASSSLTGREVPGSPSTAPAAQVAPTMGHSRPLLPHIDSQKPSSNINSESWSPLERLKSSQAEALPQAERNQSAVSSDEESPENANATNRRPSSPSRKGSASATSDITRRMSAFEVKDGNSAQNKPFASFAKPSSGGMTASRSDNNRSGGAQRPMSMYNLSSSASVPRSSGKLSPPASAGMASSGSFSKPTERPQHVRKGSINDIVSKYESLKTPVNTTSGAGEKSKKPSVAAKPAGLRKPTTDDAAKKPDASTDKPMKGPEKPAKPVKPTKPDLVRPIAVRHGDAPKPTGWSRSSSGRAFPTSSHYVPTLSSTASDRSAQAEARTSPRKSPVKMPGEEEKENGKGVSSGKSSPEKQQNVNSLIQRWNQGATAEKKPAVRKGGYV